MPIQLAAAVTNFNFLEDVMDPLTVRTPHANIPEAGSQEMLRNVTDDVSADIAAVSHNQQHGVRGGKRKAGKRS